MSRFVSAGSTDDAPTERDEAWLEAQKKIDATRQQKAQPVQQESSLYDKLQANKAAKQEAFEEATKLRNQFQSLNEDEVEFLDSILESSRKEEAELKKDTREQLEAFRKRQEEAEKAAKLEPASPVQDVTGPASWAVGPRKRKKVKGGLPGVKIRRTSTAEERDTDESRRASDKLEADHAPRELPEAARAASNLEEAKVSEKQQSLIAQPAAEPIATTGPPAASGLGLGAYSSDEGD